MAFSALSQRFSRRELARGILAAKAVSALPVASATLTAIERHRMARAQLVAAMNNREPDDVACEFGDAEYTAWFDLLAAQPATMEDHRTRAAYLLSMMREGGVEFDQEFGEAFLSSMVG